MEYDRRLDIAALLQKKSFFLLGPRSTGKTYLIRQQFDERSLCISLLLSDYYLQLSESPDRLRGIIAEQQPASGIVIIDEIQKIPALLSTVHYLIEESGYRFLLTGSSARKLKAESANLLAGRAWSAELFPLTWSEIPNFDLLRYLHVGGLPQVYASDEPHEELDAYVQTYLREEIRAEGLIRKLPPFARFLKTAALANGQLINFAAIGRDAEVAPSTVREYYSILEDTLTGFTVEPWRASKKRKAVATAKFYFFDPGVTHMLTGTRVVEPHSNVFGTCFEQFIAMELRAYLSYARKKLPLQFWRSKDGAEVDFIVGESIAIEVKASRRVQPKHVKGLRLLQEEQAFQQYIVVSQDPIARQECGVRCLPWDQFLQELWAGEIC